MIARNGERNNTAQGELAKSINIQKATKFTENANSRRTIAIH